MSKGIFDKLSTTKEFTYEFSNGVEPIAFTYRLLRNKDVIEITKHKPEEEQGMMFILYSIKDGFEDEVTIEDVFELPMGLTEQMLKDIIDFNQIEIDMNKIK